MSDKLLPVKLVAPVVKDGSTLKGAIMKRHSSREFSPQPLTLKDMSELLWAAYGVNRKATLGRTVPSACAVYPLDLYVFTAEGVYLYESEEHKLNPVVKGDLRALAGDQEFVATAPLSIAIFADRSRMRSDDPAFDASLKAHADRIAALDAGAVTENAYLRQAPISTSWSACGSMTPSCARLSDWMTTASSRLLSLWDILLRNSKIYSSPAAVHKFKRAFQCHFVGDVDGVALRACGAGETVAGSRIGVSERHFASRRCEEPDKCGGCR